MGEIRQAYSQSLRFASMAAVVVILVGFVAVRNFVHVTYPAQGQPESTSSLSIVGDICVKLALISGLRSGISQELLLESIAYYTKAFPSTAALRRAAILKTDIFGESGYALIAKAKKMSPEERDFWRHALDTKPLACNKAVAMAHRAEHLSIGPLQGVLQARIFRLSGMNAEADLVMVESVQRAKILVTVFGLTSGIMVVANLAGIWLFFMIGIRVFKQPNKLLQGQSGQNVRLSGFVAYLLVYILMLAAGTFAFSNSSAEVLLAFQGCASLVALTIGVCISGTGMSAFMLPTSEDMKPQMRMGAIGYLITLPAIHIISFLGKLLFRSLPEVVNPLVEMVSQGGWPVLAFAFIIAVVIAPVVEETMFRGILFGSLRARMKFWPACLVSSVIFAVLHQASPSQLVPLLLLGCAFAVLRERSGSLVPGMVFHALNNAVALLIITSLFL